MLVHMCRRCGFQTTVFDDWVNHLWEQQHQKVSRSSFLKWSDDDNLRSLVIYAPTEPYPLPSEVILLFTNLLISVVDFVCWTERPQNFVVQFSHKDDVERVMKMSRQQSPDLAFGGNTLGLRRKGDIEDFEWPGLIGAGSARNGSTENPVLIELSDDSNSNDFDDDVMGSGKENGEDASNGSGRNVRMNGRDNMEIDDTFDEDDTTSTNDDADQIVEIETKMSDEFRDIFLEKIRKKKKKTEDDKRSVEKNLQLLMSQWLDVYVDFHNKLWPLCIVASNKKMQTNRNEVGFEAKFVCSCLKTKYSEWLCKIRQKKKEIDIDQISSEFLNILSNESEADDRLNEIKKYIEQNDRTTVLKFKCHIIVTFLDSGIAIAKLKFHKIEGRNTKLKMMIVEKIFRRLFRKYETLKINEWNPVGGDKRKIKKEKGESSWTQIEIITVE